MPNKGLQFSTKAGLGAEDGPPVQLLSQWRQQKSYKAAVQQPQPQPLVGIRPPVLMVQDAQSPSLSSPAYTVLLYIQDALQPELTNRMF